MTPGLRAVPGHFRTFGQELADIGFAGERARTCTRTALSVVLAVTVAQWADLDNAWWAGISGLMASQATRPASVERALTRIVCTILAAAVAFVVNALAGGDQAAIYLFLFVSGFVGVLGMGVSPHGYAWLFSALTANMIVMMTMGDPAATPFVAFDRIAEVTVGCLAAVLMALLIAPEGGGGAPSPAAPGWRDLLGAQWPAVQHAVRSAVTIVLLPVVWNLFDLPSLSQMAITVVAVMGVPVGSGDPADLAATLTTRGLHRVVGCLCGGLLGLACIALPLTLYPLWLAALCGGVWIFVHVQSGSRGVSYAGLQAAIVFVITLVQGPGPPASLVPCLERLVGILGGLAVMMLVGLLLWPAPDATRRPAASPAP